MTSELDLLRARTSAAIGARMPGHLQRLRWSPAQLADFQRDRLRALLARAIERSPFHAARLRDLDPARAPAVREFQVRQTDRGAEVTAVVEGAPDLAALSAAVQDALRRAGLPGPQVVIRRVDALDRDPLTGKARRFIPLGGPGKTG
jgi:hypothetical protein